MKFAVSSYSFHTLTESGKYKEKELIKLAKDIGFDSIEFAEIHPEKESKKASYAEKLREESEKQGVPIINYAIGCDFLNGSDGDTDKEIERLCKEVDIAEILGCKMLRHDVTRGFDKDSKLQTGFDNILPKLIKGCTSVSEYAKEKGIRTMSENHGYFFQDSDRVEKLVTGVHNENYGLLLDMGNFLCADENPEKAFGKLIPYAFHIHAKDFHIKSGNNLPPQDAFFTTRAGNYLRGAIIGHGDVPVFQCLKILKMNDYSGSITVEFEGIEDPEKGTAYGLNTLKYMTGLLGL